ncbi:hypothetical protein Ddc_04027 [Ditylenchus destructor]|nr:hypothetical protein Ddc_04027 [Ditylenchus destructor]
MRLRSRVAAGASQPTKKPEAFWRYFIDMPADLLPNSNNQQMDITQSHQQQAFNLVELITQQQQNQALYNGNSTSRIKNCNGLDEASEKMASANDRHSNAVISNNNDEQSRETQSRSNSTDEDEVDTSGGEIPSRSSVGTNSCGQINPQHSLNNPSQNTQQLSATANMGCSLNAALQQATSNISDVTASTAAAAAAVGSFAAFQNSDLFSSFSNNASFLSYPNIGLHGIRSSSSQLPFTSFVFPMFGPQKCLQSLSSPSLATQEFPRHYSHLQFITLTQRRAFYEGHCSHPQPSLAKTADWRAKNVAFHFRLYYDPADCWFRKAHHKMNGWELDKLGDWCLAVTIPTAAIFEEISAQKVGHKKREENGAFKKRMMAGLCSAK